MPDLNHSLKMIQKLFEQIAFFASVFYNIFSSSFFHIEAYLPYTTEFRPYRLKSNSTKRFDIRISNMVSRAKLFFYGFEVYSKHISFYQIRMQHWWQFHVKFYSLCCSFLHCVSYNKFYRCL